MPCARRRSSPQRSVSPASATRTSTPHLLVTWSRTTRLWHPDGSTRSGKSSHSGLATSLLTSTQVPYLKVGTFQWEVAWAALWLAWVTSQRKSENKREQASEQASKQASKQA